MRWTQKIFAYLSNGLAQYLPVGLWLILLLPILWGADKTRWLAALPYLFYLLAGHFRPHGKQEIANEN